jgi:Ni,Fe-hydrogenase I cytochrome b subunit
MEKLLESEGKVLRHDRTVRIIHWLIALSCFVLVFSGFGQMPVYKRYMITDLPGLDLDCRLLHHAEDALCCCRGFGVRQRLACGVPWNSPR